MGLSIAEIARRIQRSGLRDLRTSKTPEACTPAPGVGAPWRRGVAARAWAGTGGQAGRGSARGAVGCVLSFELVTSSGGAQPACVQAAAWSASAACRSGRRHSRPTERHARLRQLLCAGAGKGKHGRVCRGQIQCLRREGQSRGQSQHRPLSRRCVSRPRRARGRAGVRGGRAVAGCGVRARGAGHVRAGVALHAAQVRPRPAAPVLPLTLVMPGVGTLL